LQVLAKQLWTLADTLKSHLDDLRVTNALAQVQKQIEEAFPSIGRPRGATGPIGPSGRPPSAGGGATGAVG
jgi:hypothetical protein